MSSLLTGQSDRLRERVVRAAEGPVIAFLLFVVAFFLPDLADGCRIHASLHILLLASGVFVVLFSVLFRLLIRHEEDSYLPLILLVSALLGMGLLNGLQAGYADLPFPVVGGIGFLLVWLFFLRTHQGDPPGQNRFLVNGSFLFALASFLSFFPSQQWNILWWFHHLLLFFASLLYIFFLLNSCRDEAKKLRKNYEELEATKKKFSDVFEHSPSLIALQDAGGRFVLTNEHFEKYFGLEQKDIIGRLEKEILPAHQKRVRSFEQLQEKREYEETLLINNEKRVLATSRFPLTSCGQEKCGVGYIRTDITDQKDLEYQLLLDQKILANTGEAVVITDVDGSIVDINKAYTRITGYKPREIIGENPRVCKSGHHDQAFYEAMWKGLLETGKWSGKIRDRRKNGEVYQKWLSINAIYDNTGDTINYVGIFTDITEKRRVEKQLKELLLYDPLTNLPNRTLFEELLSQALLNSQFHDVPLVLLCIDMNRFKVINDTLGYKAGDDRPHSYSEKSESWGFTHIERVVFFEK
ncbi:MAG: PAS domain-containing sensor histidine kinase [Candidatus Electrothrix sp. GM3_4]|nr:PAS domain-containing sensor histidine kinase [Candidatus Electrothrix sp. GM3_4]